MTTVGRGDIVCGRYRIERELARGGMGRVFLATQHLLGRTVAIKFLADRYRDKESKLRFLFEAEVASKLRHPHIVEVHDFGVTDADEPFLVMEYLDGPTLADVLREREKVPVARLCQLAIQVGRALREAHLNGVVHADLKPSNIILLRRRGEDDEEQDFVKVVDFGLVRAIEASSSPRSPVAVPMPLMGSPYYLAPEQIRQSVVGAGADVYAFGAVIFHALAGRPPYLGVTSNEVLTHHLESQVPRLKLPAESGAAELEVICRRCLQKNVSERYSDMKEVLLELRAVLRLIELTGGVRSPPAPTTDPPSFQPVMASTHKLDGSSSSVQELHFDAEPRGWEWTTVAATAFAITSTLVFWMLVLS